MIRTISLRDSYPLRGCSCGSVCLGWWAYLVGVATPPRSKPATTARAQGDLTVVHADSRRSTTRPGCQITSRTAYHLLRFNACYPSASADVTFPDRPSGPLLCSLQCSSSAVLPAAGHRDGFTRYWSPPAASPSFAYSVRIRPAHLEQFAWLAGQPVVHPATQTHQDSVASDFHRVGKMVKV